MSTSKTRRETGKALFLLGTSLCMGIVAMEVGCSNSNKAYENPLPNVSTFTTGKLLNGIFTPTTAGQQLKIAVGGTVMLRANFAMTGGTAIVTPGNISMTSNVPVTINNVTETTTYTLTVTNQAGQVTTSTVTAVVLPPPTNLHYATAAATYYKDVDVNSVPVTVAGGGTYTYTVTPDLPAGMSINASTGAITGKPQAVKAQTTYTITAVDEVNQSTPGTITFDVADTPLDLAFNVRAVKVGDSATLTWDATKVAGVFDQVTISASPADTTLPTTFPLAGNVTVTPAVTTVYTVTLHPVSGGANTVRTLTLTVGDGPVLLENFIATPAVVKMGDTSVLSWDALNAPLSLTLNGEDVMGLASKTVSPVRRSFYTLQGSNLLNATPAVATINVAAQGADLLAGSTAGPGYADGTGASAKFALNSGMISSTTASSMGLSVDPSGNVYVADPITNVIRMVTPAGVTTTLAGKAGVPWINTTVNGDGSGNGAAARFKTPAQVLYSDDSTLYVVDYGTHSVRKMAKQNDGTWTVSNLVGTVGSYGNATSTTNLDNPLAAVLYNNKLFIASSYDSSIRVWDLATSKLTTLCGGGTGQQFGLNDATGTAALFRTLSGMTIDPTNGDIYVADRENHAIRKVTQAGVVTTIAGAYPTAAAAKLDGSGTSARFNRPTGIVRASDGSLYVTDNNNNDIRKLTWNATSSAWDVTTVAGNDLPGYAEGTGTAIQFNGPEGIAIKADGTLVIADAGSSLIRTLTPSAGSFTSATIAGAKDSGLVNGTIQNAKFFGPNGVAVDKNNTAYIADESNKVIRKISADGAVTTWGTGVTLNAPYGVAVDNNLNVFVLDRLAASIKVYKIAVDGGMTDVTPTGYVFTTNNPKGIAVTPAGDYLYLADNKNIRRFKLADGTAAGAITSGLSVVTGIAVDATNVYFTDYAYHCVRKAALDLTGLATVAGANASSGYGFIDGALATAKFNAPTGITILKDGTTGVAKVLYVVDQLNYAVRKVDLGTSLVSTLIGAADTTVGNGVPVKLNTSTGSLNGGTTGTSGLYLPKGIGITTFGDLLVTSGDGIMQVTAPEGQ